MIINLHIIQSSESYFIWNDDVYEPLKDLPSQRIVFDFTVSNTNMFYCVIQKHAWVTQSPTKKIRRSGALIGFLVPQITPAVKIWF